jgi:hypothetical protein
MRLPIAAAAAALVLSFSARADENSYAGQIMFADAFSSTTYLMSTNTRKSPSFSLASMAGFAIGGPLVHFANQKPARAVTSLALRIGLSLAGSLITARTVGDPGRGMAVGAVAAMLADALVVAHF